jgi:hypothetical protein
MVCNKKSFFVLILFVLFSISNAHSQTLSVYNFLKLDVDARSSSLAGSFVAMENDANLIFYNPAGISTITSPKASAGFFKYLLDINSGNVAYAQKYKDIGYFGIGIRYINYGTFDKFDESFNNLGTFTGNDFALSLGYANKYKNIINYGVNLKFIQSKYDEYSSTAIAADLGLFYSIPNQSFNIGVSCLNLGAQLKSYIDTKEQLPLDVRFGISKKLEHLPLTLNIGFSKLNEDYDNFFNRFRNLIIGGEFVLSDYVDLRIGYNNANRQDLKTGTSIGIAGFSAGLGIKIESYTLDYAFNSLGNVGGTHRINIGYSFK